MENYLINAECKYTYTKLKDVVYLFNENHTKLIYDNTEVKIEQLSQTPIQLDVRNVELSEQSALDERYEFDKTLTFSLDGFYDQTIFNQRYYAIVEDIEGKRWCINVDFPSFVTYTYDLSSNEHSTKFSFHSLSNFPTMRLVSDFAIQEPPCHKYSVPGADSLQMIERNSVELDVTSGKVYTFGADFSNVVPLKNSITLQQTFDGERITDTLTFTIPFDTYKWGWHYNLQRFLWNKYSAIIRPKGTNTMLYVGFNFGLEPTYTVERDDDAQMIRITLTEASNVGLTASEVIEKEADDNTSWNGSSKVPTRNELEMDDAYECVEGGKAMYLLQEETYANGQPTGRYKVKQGYEHYFDDYPITIVGTFTEDIYFYSPDCANLRCPLSTSIPSMLTFTATTSYTFFVDSECSWSFTNVPSGVTVSPSSGTGRETVTITCSSIPSEGLQQTMYINVGGEYVKPITVKLVGVSDGRIKPTVQRVSCLEQGVYFTVPYNYQYTAVSVDHGGEFYTEGNKLIVYTPANVSTSSTVTYTATIRDANGTYTLTIIQDHVYTSYVQLQSTMCEGSDLYYEEELYTGTTMSTLQPTGIMRKGTLIETGSTRCEGSQSRWTDNGNLICIDGDKWSLLEEEKLVNGVWTPTGDVRPDTLLERNSAYCQQTIYYEWRLTTNWVCETDDIIHL